MEYAVFRPFTSKIWCRRFIVGFLRVVVRKRRAVTRLAVETLVESTLYRMRVELKVFWIC